METVMNAYRVRVKKCCASCGLKEVDNDGNRICTGMQLKVSQKFVCPKYRVGGVSEWESIRIEIELN